MHKLIRTTFAAAALATVAAATPSAAEIGLGADVVSRYVWRGTDFGNAVSVQPGIAWSNDVVEVGAWSSWAIDGGGANENDLYITVAAGPVDITVTDYFFPAAAPADFFDYSDDAGIHILEASASLQAGPASIMGAFNFLGDSEDSFWVQAYVPIEALTMGDTEVGVTVGGGNGVYTTDTDPNVAQVSLDVSQGDYFGQYILNPEAEITFLVFGMTF